MNQEESFATVGGPFFNTHRGTEGPRHHLYENILRYVQKAPDDIRWTIDRTEFDELIAMKKDSAPGPDGIPYDAYRCAGGLGSKFLFDANRACEEVLLFLVVLLKPELSLSPRPLTPMTMEELFDLQTRFVH